MQAEVSTSDADEAVLASDYQATQPNETDNRCCRRKDLQSVKVMGCNPEITQTLNNDAVRIFNGFADIFYYTFSYLRGSRVGRFVSFHVSTLHCGKSILREG